MVTESWPSQLNHNELTDLCFNLKTLTITQLSLVAQSLIISANPSTLHFLLFMSRILLSLYKQLNLYFKQSNNQIPIFKLH